MLALSGAVILMSLGLTLIASLAFVIWIGLAAPSTGACYSRVLVLGMRLRRDGTIPELYRQRLDRARILLCCEASAEAILLGGVTAGAATSEAEAGRAWLCAAGVASARIRTEGRSRHTLENLLHYRADFPAPAQAPLLVTNRFHLARSSLLARGLGIAHVRCAAETSKWKLLGQFAPMLKEAKLIHWFIVGRTYARLARNHRMAARIS